MYLSHLVNMLEQIFTLKLPDSQQTQTSEKSES